MAAGTASQRRPKVKRKVSRKKIPADTATYSGRIAARLQKLREEAGMSQEQLAAKLTEMGHECTQWSIFAWERNTRKLPSDMFPALAEIFGLQVRTFLPIE